MKLNVIPAAAAALALVATPVFAQATVAERAPAPVTQGEEIGGKNGMLIALLATAAVIAGVIIIASDDKDDDEPTSP